MSREQQDVQSFADGNLQHKLELIKIINRMINAIKKINRSTAPENLHSMLYVDLELGLGLGLG